MPTPLTHAVVGASLTVALPAAQRRFGLAATLAVVAALPDLDVVGFAAGVPYASLLGHRGLLHSLPVAGMVAAVVAATVAIGGSRPWHRLARVLPAAFAAVASHGLLDTMTNGGLGVGLLLPFHPGRYFAPFRPIEVSPISPARFLTDAAPVIASEVLWVWIPLAVVLCGVGIATRRKAATEACRP